MNDQAALLTQIIVCPDDDVLRLAYADCLEENGQPERAEFIRVQIELTKPEPEPPKRPSTLGILVRVAIPFGGAIAAASRIDRYKAELKAHTEHVARRVEYRMRETELLQAHAREWFVIPGLSACSVWDHLRIRWFPEGDSRGFDEVFAGDAARGFVDSLTCTVADWVAHGDTILAAHPVRKVTLTTLMTPLDVEWFASDGLKARIRGRAKWVPQYVRGSERGLKEITLSLLAAEWPGVKFALNEFAEINNLLRQLQNATMPPDDEIMATAIAAGNLAIANAAQARAVRRAVDALMSADYDEKATSD